MKKSSLQNIWVVANRISPENGSNIRSGMKMNIVRMIGGIKKTVNGVAQKDLDFDPCHYDSIKSTYVYNWEPLINRLNKIVHSQTEILQIALDQPPWAFQYGYTFIPEGTCDKVHFRENEEISHYGNSLPPADKQAYHDFIKALIKKLVDTYGKQKVLSWRFRVGSEIETPDHWYGTKQDFIEHFANTEKAVRAILPTAKIGVHTRAPGFLYKKGTVLNYKGESFASFANDLITYSYDNNLSYDFWGISDYVIINNAMHRDMLGKFDQFFAPLVEHPKWNANATIDIMEYATVTTMSGEDMRGFINCATSHKEIVELAYSNLFYKNKEKGLDSFYRWGNRIGSKNSPAISTLNTMQGMQHYKTLSKGSANASNNILDAVFAKNEFENKFDVLLYNYSVKSLDYIEAEPVTILFKSEYPVGTVVKYRKLKYGKSHNKLQNFLLNGVPSDWVKKGSDLKGDPKRTLTKVGVEAYGKYTNPNPHKYTGWFELKSTARMDGKKGSVIKMNTLVSSFSFEKYEFKIVNL
ncbi:GH39 family glycosyl hydrolase [Flavicella sediminum]|uniref:GH39 family glycosyl hydrolase n=1 Tax=Flavicella sediminum TaxID=2585141 RepID=UPI0011231EB2|nr:hypothetical protein [Flavicella sediminum]